MVGVVGDGDSEGKALDGLPSMFLPPFEVGTTSNSFRNLNTGWGIQAETRGGGAPEEGQRGAGPQARPHPGGLRRAELTLQAVVLLAGTCLTWVVRGDFEAGGSPGMTHSSGRSLEPARRAWRRRNRSGNRTGVRGDSREGVSPTPSAPALVPVRTPRVRVDLRNTAGVS